ncbi:MAG: SRPBCC family protein [Niabella sp.]
MKFIKLFIISGIVFFFIITIISLFIPSTVRVSRATNIAPGNDTVLELICDLHNWKSWHPQWENVVLKDTVLSDGRIITATANGVLLTVSQCSGSMVSVEMLKGKRPLKNQWRLIKHNSGDSITLQNYIDFHFNWYPWEKFSSLMLDKSYGPVMEQSLENLKNLP